MMCKSTTAAAKAGRALAGLALFLVGGALSGCKPGNGAALVTMSLAPALPGSLALIVRHVTFDLSAGTHQSAIRFPEVESTPLTFPKTVSLTFPSGVGSMLLIDARGYDGTNQTAMGTVTVPIASGAVTQAALAWSAYVSPTDGGIDGATADLTSLDLSSTDQGSGADQAAAMDLAGLDQGMRDLLPVDLRPGG